jgi:hypothetical protein
LRKNILIIAVFQFIGEKSMVINRYVTGYVSKKEHGVLDDVWEAIEKHKSSIGNYISLGMRMLRYREMGAPEASMKALGLPFCGFSDEIMYLPTATAEHRRRVLVDVDEAKKREKQDKKSTVYKPNLVDTYYPGRPDSMDTLSLFEVASKFTYVKANPYKTKEKRDEMDKKYRLKTCPGYLKPRGKAKLLKIYVPPLIDRAAVEDMCRQKLFMFQVNILASDTLKKSVSQFYALFKFPIFVFILQPWRNEDELIGSAKSYEEAYNQFDEKVREAAEDYFGKLDRVQKAKDLDHMLNADKIDEAEEETNIEDNPALQPDPNFQYGAQTL